MKSAYADRKQFDFVWTLSLLVHKNLKKTWKLGSQSKENLDLNPNQNFSNSPHWSKSLHNSKIALAGQIPMHTVPKIIWILRTESEPATAGTAGFWDQIQYTVHYTVCKQKPDIYHCFSSVSVQRFKLFFGTVWFYLRLTLVFWGQASVIFE